MKKLYLYRRFKYRMGGYRRKSKKSSKSKLYIIYGTMICVATCTGIISAGKRVSSLVLRMGEVQLENQVRGEFNKISAQILEKYSDEFNNIALEDVDDGKNTKYIKVNFTELNEFKCELTDELTNYLCENRNFVCKIPAGAFVSDDIFAAQGVEVPVKISSSGNASVELSDDFVSGGINQTVHRLILKIRARVHLHTVLEKTEREIEIDIPVTERIIIGEVPSFLGKL